MRRTFVGLVVMSLLALGGLTTASAAGLNLGAGRMTAATAHACTTTAIPLVRSDPVWGGLAGYESVTVTIPSSCAGLPLQVTVYQTSDGRSRSSGSVPSIATGTVVVPMSSLYGHIFYPAYGFAVVIDGWSVPVQA
ncbi:hypothetical protein [Cellulomonas sp. KRMCY2]|uniref:hypothetical protein n=1 Tax=Cellulomonas sp. KRMCY2 TaxID=1304865 RepID=UPI00045E5D05|nr:hypothetical protein [Cellulomonas sp. KRMCY2]